MRTPPTPGLVIAGLLVVPVLALGCTSASTSNTARTATEQLLVSNAVDRALDKVDFRPFSGRAIFLDEKYVDCVDKQYVLASLRHRLLYTGARLVDKPDDAEIVLEPRAGGVGTSQSDSFLGTPELVLPGMITLPEVRLLTRSRQSGVAKLGLVAYDPKTRSSLGHGGLAVAQSDDSNYYFMGIGPFQSGSLKSDLARTTQGNAGIVRTQIPPQVAFSAPQPGPPEELPGALQYTSDEQPEEGRPNPFYPPQ